MSVRLFVRPSVRPFPRLRLGGFLWKFIFEDFRKSVKIEVSLKSDKENGYFTWRPVWSVDHISLNSSWHEKLKKKVVKNIKTRILWSQPPPFFSENRAAFMRQCEKIFRTRQATDDNMAQAHWMLDTYGYKRSLRTFIAFPLLQWLHERVLMYHLYIPSLYLQNYWL